MVKGIYLILLTFAVIIVASAIFFVWWTRMCENSLQRVMDSRLDLAGKAEEGAAGGSGGSGGKSGESGSGGKGRDSGGSGGAASGGGSAARGSTRGSAT